MMSSTLSKIHVTNSTGLSLNERFTAISTQPKVVTNIGTTRRSRSRSRSVQRQVPVPAAAERVTSRANQRLLAQLQRKHKVQAALKLKRRSMRTVGGRSNGSGGANGRIRRGTVKAFRVGANGKPIRTNSLTRIATMNADREITNNRGRPLRRSNSSNNLAGRLGPRRPTVGGAAQRVARRNIDRQRGRNSVGNRGRSTGLNNRGRSRSRSRTRTLSDNGRNRSRTRNNSDNQLNNRSRSRNRNSVNAQTNNNNNNVRRGRSRSRSRGRVAAGSVNKSNLPIKARLGVRPGVAANRGTNNRRGRNASLTRRGVQTGRVQKRRNSTNANAAGNDNNGRGRMRSRSAVRNNSKNGNVRSRSRSRTRKGQVGQQRQQQGSGQVRQQRNNRAPRGRQQQRRGNNISNGQRGTNNNGKAQTQQRRGRSRSRTGRGANSGGNSRNQGNKSAAATKPAVNKDALDKELDQYMATTKTEHEMDYLLKN
ncbi:putative uncharacterized protein DDB_G0286901 isoform X1 [Lucilia sericata]|uniref:putative uncharacterized protein DDB_G0286901 isoform X1 n=1 Tax=Lucilia sericata TaxID=13632 RepID=UPI0018A82539|nr:putative uncharacterized protein DDB_G0286901 isoform X1 [Lucilia sericata]